MSTEKIYLYPKWIRLWHLLNAILCLALIITGISLQYSGSSAAIVSFQYSVKIHNIAGILLSFSYLFFFFGNLFTSNGIHYRPRFAGAIKNIFKQMRYYAFGIFKKEKAPFPITKENKFNPLQRIAYKYVMYLFIPMVIATGWLMFYPGSHINMISWNGMIVTNLFHIIGGFVISMFLVVHLYFCTIGATPTSNFKSIVNGYHESHD